MKLRAVVPVRSGVLLALALSAAAASQGCGYAVVRNRAAMTTELAADSVRIRSLQEQLSVLSARCRADSLQLATLRAAPPRPVASPTTPAADSILRARDAEITTLRDQLTRANAELERIKRRLANPRS